MSDNAKFLNGSLMRHIMVMSFTASIGLMAIFMVDLVDMILISMLGNAALAAAIAYAGAILFLRLLSVLVCQLRRGHWWRRQLVRVMMNLHGNAVPHR